jgi:tetratricopeptide (TPR) repeat protein
MLGAGVARAGGSGAHDGAPENEEEKNKMKSTLAVLLFATPALAQQPPPQQRPQPYYYPPPQQQPYYYPPPQQQPHYYPPPQQEPAQPPGQDNPYAKQPQTVQRLTLTSRSDAAVTATWACADAVERHHLDVARKQCGEALAKDDSLGLAHLMLALAQPADLAHNELQRASELGRRSSPGEHYFIEAAKADWEGRTGDAKRLYEQLVTMLPGEPRAWLERATFRLESGDAEGALIDAKRSAELDAKFGPAYGAQALALVARGQFDDATLAAKKYLEVQPGEADAHATLARVALRRADIPEALAAAKKAVFCDDKFAPGHRVYGDALLFAGRAKEARKEYGVLIGTDDPAVHHDGAMREARSFVFDGRPGEAEKAMAAEVALAEKTKRPGDQADALIELARLQIDRGAVVDAGQSLRQAGDVLNGRDQRTITEAERRDLQADALEERCMVLAAVGERQTAEVRAEELGTILRVDGNPHAADRAAALKGWIAARNRDDKGALAGLASATRPTLRMALALALVRANQQPKAKVIMEELARRNENDLEGALSRTRAAAWLKSQK